VRAILLRALGVLNVGWGAREPFETGGPRYGAGPRLGKGPLLETVEDEEGVGSARKLDGMVRVGGGIREELGRGGGAMADGFGGGAIGAI
jgi:hypothetical protein